MAKTVIAANIARLMRGSHLGNTRDGAFRFIEKTGEQGRG
jgi:hypothetical protein